LPPDFECVPGAVGPGVYDGDIELSSGPVPELGGLACVTGNVIVQGSTLTDLSVLTGAQQIGGELSVLYNEQLTSLDGLDVITRIGGGFTIMGNDVLADLAGLSELNSMGDE